MRAYRIKLSLVVAGLAAAIAPLGATTLLQLSLNDMIQQSTGIVRATVTGVRTDTRSGDVYTYYQLQVSEDWRSPSLTPAVPQMEVAIPGGVVGGRRQTVAGAPSLQVGQQYVIFLWTSRSGLTQVIGLSQGLFLVKTDTSGNLVLIRPAASETMLNQNGQVVQDQGMSYNLAALRSQVRQTLGVGQ
jgi:hypothetical protein